MIGLLFRSNDFIRGIIIPMGKISWVWWLVRVQEKEMVTYVGRAHNNLDCAFLPEIVIVSCQNTKDTEGVVVVCRPIIFNRKLIKLA